MDETEGFWEQKNTRVTSGHTHTHTRTHAHTHTHTHTHTALTDSDSGVALLGAGRRQRVLQEAVQRRSLQVKGQLVGGAVGVRGPQEPPTQTG